MARSTGAAPRAAGGRRLGEILVEGTGRPWEDLARCGQALIAEASHRVSAGRTIEDTWLAAALPTLAAAAAGGWQALVGPLPKERSYQRIVASPHLEAWLIFWPEAGRLHLHDHGGASGAFQVVTGALDEYYLSGGVAPVRHRRVQAGELVSFDGTYVHDVVNVLPTGATSVHLYAAAERTMRFYDLDGTLLRPLSSTSGEAEVVEPGSGPSRLNF